MPHHLYLTSFFFPSLNCRLLPGALFSSAYESVGPIHSLASAINSGLFAQLLPTTALHPGPGNPPTHMPSNCPAPLSHYPLLPGVQHGDGALGYDAAHDDGFPERASA